MQCVMSIAGGRVGKKKIRELKRQLKMDYRARTVHTETYTWSGIIAKQRLIGQSVKYTSDIKVS